MVHRLSFRVLIAVLWASVASAAPSAAPTPESEATPPTATGTITGVVRDAEGTPIPGVTVSVLDGATGIPVHRDSWRPFTDVGGGIERTLAELLAATTDAAGAFRFEGAAPGRYRLVAQSWRTGRPPIEPVEPGELLEVNGGAIHLHGVATVDAVAGAAVDAVITPLGTGMLILGDHAPNDGTLLMLSVAAPRFDPALGWMGWPGPFLRGLVGFNVMPEGETVVRGLPEGDVHVVVFSIDDVPGFGAATVPIRNGIIMFALVPFVTDWSDAQHAPPPSLAPLVERLARADPPPHSAGRGLLAEHLRPGATAAETEAGLAKVAAEMVDLEDGGALVPAGDLLAALAYLARRESFAASGRRLNPHRSAVVRPATLKESWTAGFFRPEPGTVPDG